MSLGAAGLVLLGLAWCTLTAWRVYDDLSAARADAEVLRATLARGDVDGARRARARFEEASSSAADRTDGVVWQAFEAMPVVGDDAEGLATTADVLADLGRRGVPALVDEAQQLTAGAYAPSDHEFPLSRIAALSEPAAESHAAFQEAAERLAPVDSSGFVAPLRREFDALRRQVRSAAEVLDAAERASRLMPTLLGADGPRDYLLVFQNNAEVRALGGLPGIMSLVHAEDGRVEITRQESAGAMGELDQPVLDLTEEEERLYGRQLGTYFLDSNFTPDMPRAAQLWRARWRLETGTDIDGVFVVDPVAMSYLLEGTEPIVVEGRTLTPATIVAEVEHFPYLRYDNQVAQDAFFNAVAKRTFDVFADGAGDPVRMVQGLIRGVNEGRVLMHLFDTSAQQVIADTRIAGDLGETAGEPPQAGVFLNDGTAAKLSVFLDYDVEVTARSCTSGRQRLEGRLQITSDTPRGVEDLPATVTGLPDGFADDVPAGHQLVIADIYGPVGGEVGELRIGGEGQPTPDVERWEGREVLSVGLPLAPGQTRVISWTMTTSAGPDGPVEVWVTPGARPENESSVVPSAC